MKLKQGVCVCVNVNQKPEKITLSSHRVGFVKAMLKVTECNYKKKESKIYNKYI